MKLYLRSLQSGRNGGHDVEEQFQLKIYTHLHTYMLLKSPKWVANNTQEKREYLAICLLDYCVSGILILCGHDEEQYGC